MPIMGNLKGYSDLISLEKSTNIDFCREEAGIAALDIDMDRGSHQVSVSKGSSLLPMCHGDSGHQIQIFQYNDAPGYLQGNPYVKGGYRAFLPSERCIESLFVWSNETINIWSHLIGFFIFFFLMLWDNAVWIPNHHGSTMDHVVLSAGLVCFQFCMLCSTGYHLFRCCSENANMRWLALDLTGISVGLLGCYLPGVHYAFYCLSIWRDLYLLVICGLFAAVLFYQTQPRYYSDAWFKRRILLYIGLTAYGIVPTSHWIYLNGGFSSPLVQDFAPKVLVVYLLGVAAFFFYITKCPERCQPGTFDYVGSSHQLWHIIIVVAFIWWHYSGQHLLRYRLTHTCEA